MKDTDHVFALLQDIKDMLVGLSILLAGLLAALFLGQPAWPSCLLDCYHFGCGRSRCCLAGPARL